VVLAFEYRVLEAQIRELQRSLGKKATAHEMLREPVSLATGSRKPLLRSTSLVRVTL
jgi:transposase